METSQVTWSTPKKSTELKAQIVEFQRLQEQDQSTRRLLFWKILKGFEVQESVLADQELKIQSLEAQLEASRPKKRRKVRTSPNSKFADIKAIKRARDEAAGVLIRVESSEVSEDSDASSLSDSTADCIEVLGG